MHFRQSPSVALDSASFGAWLVRFFFKSCSWCSIFLVRVCSYCGQPTGIDLSRYSLFCLKIWNFIGWSPTTLTLTVLSPASSLFLSQHWRGIWRVSVFCWVGVRIPLLSWVLVTNSPGFVLNTETDKMVSELYSGYQRGSSKGHDR